MTAVQYCGLTLCFLPPVTEQVLDLTPFPLCLHHLSTLVPFSEEPKDAAAYESLAEAYQHEAKFADAAALLTQALALRKAEKDPLVLDTAYELAYIQVTYLECPELAIPHLRSSLAITSPQSIKAMQCVKLLAQALLDTYDYKEANRILSESVSCLSDCPDLARIHNLQAWCLQLQGYKDQAEYRLLQSLERVEKQWPGSEVEAETWLYLASVSKTVLYAEKALEYYNSREEACEDLLRCLQALLVWDSFTISRWTGLHLRPPSSPLGVQVTHLFNAIHKTGDAEAINRIRAYRSTKGPALARELQLYVCIHEYDQSQIVTNSLQEALDICLSTGSLVAFRYMELVTLVYDTWEQAECYLQRLAEKTGRMTALVRYYLMKEQHSAALSVLHSRLTQSPSLQTRSDLAQFCYYEAPLKSLATELYTQLLAYYQQLDPCSITTAETCYRLGTLALDAQNYSAAQSYLLSALNLYKERDFLSAAACLKRLGTCFQQQNCIESALAAFKDSIRLYQTFHPAARFTITAIGALAECQKDATVWSELLSALRQGGNQLYLARTLEHSIRSQPTNKGEILEELRNLYLNLHSYNGLIGTLVAQVRLYEDLSSAEEVDRAQKGILRLMKEADSPSYGSMLKKVERCSPPGWKTAFLREELALARSSPSDSLSRALVELAEERNEDFHHTRSQSSLDEAEQLLEEAFPLLRGSLSLAAARLLQRVSRVINQHVVNEELEREAMGRVILAGGSVTYGQLGNCKLKSGDMEGTEECLSADIREDDASISRLNMGLRIVYGLSSYP